MKIHFAGLLFLLLCAGCATQNSTQNNQSGEPEKFSGATPLEWSERLADSEIARRGDSLAWKAGGKAKWDYSTGLFTLSLLKLNEAARNSSESLSSGPAPVSPQYVDFPEDTIGSFIEDNGRIKTYNRGEFQLDALNPGKTALALWKLSHDQRYKDAAYVLYFQFASQPRTPEGGFWHKQRYTNQMWLDGSYMALPFYAECGQVFEQSSAFNDVARQIHLIDQHTYDPETGLNYHGWDEAKIQPWANPETGCSSNFWGRAEGWYVMALVDVLDYMPAKHPAREKIIAVLRKTARGIVKWQNPQTGLWWQVLDQGYRPGNYQEATASSMFIYALAKGINNGYLPRSYIPAVEKGYRGIIENLIQHDPDNRWSLTHCCSVAGLGGSPSNRQMRDGSFKYYISEPVVTNDLKGMGPFILAGIEMQRLTRTNNR